MTLQAAITQQPSDDAPGAVPDAVCDFARPSFEQKKADLERLAAIGMEIAESLGRLAADTPLLKEQGEPLTIRPAEIILGFNRIARCVRLTHTLHTEVVEQLRRIEGIEEGQAREAGRKRADLSQAREHTVRSVLTRIIHDEAFGPEDAGTDADEADSDLSGERERETCERLIGEARECLKDRERFGDLMGLPISDIIARICRDLGVTPDWLRLSEDAWAREEVRSGVVGEALAKIHESLPLDGGTRSEGAKQPAAGVGVTAEVPTRGLRQADPPRSPPSLPFPHQGGRVQPSP
jgi:hypothetical protein